MLTERQIKTKWHYIKGGLRNMWGHLTEEDLNEIDGDMDRLRLLLSKTLNESTETIEADLKRVLDSYDNASDMADHDTNQSSYMRTPEGFYSEPNTIRTASKSQFQDKVQEIDNQSFERDKFDEKSQTELRQ